MNNVTIIIDGQQIEQFFNESVLLSIDQVGAGFSLSCPFFPETQEYRDIFKPFQYQGFELSINDELKITGVVENIVPALTDTTKIVTIQGRSKTGVIVDCTFTKEEQKEFKQATLQEIADIVVLPHSLETEFPDGAGAIFEQAAPDSPMSNKFDFLQNLARQRKLLMSQTPGGKLLFRKAKTTGSPVAELVEGQQGLILSDAEYDSTVRFSSYEGYGQEYGKTDNYAKLEDSNINVVRTTAIQANDTNQGNIEDAVKWAIGADMAASFSIPLGFESWTRPDGQLWAENELITLKAPSLMIYEPKTLLIKSVRFNGGDTQKTVDFELTIPEAYTGEIPTDL